MNDAIHAVEYVPEAYSDVEEKIIPAHERHSLSVGLIAVHGFASLKDARSALAVRIHAAQ